MTITPGWSMPAAAPVQCYLCGEFAQVEEDPLQPGRMRRSVEVGSIRWLVPEDHEGEYESKPRCHDHEGCHRRAIAAGLIWEVDDVFARLVDQRPRVAAGAGDDSSIWDAPE